MGIERRGLEGVLMYYATHEVVERGQVCWVGKTETQPAYFVCHTDDFEEIQERLPGAQLVHLRDYRYSGNEGEIYWRRKGF